MATTAMATRMTPQANGSGLARPKRSVAPTRRQRCVAVRLSCTGEAAESPDVTAVSPRSELDARIEERVRQVDEQVHGDYPGADEQRHPLNDRPVFGTHRVQQQRSDPRKRKELLDDHAA